MPQRTMDLRVKGNEIERAALDALAETEGITASEMLRRLVRDEAKRRELWPPQVEAEPASAVEAQL